MEGQSVRSRTTSHSPSPSSHSASVSSSLHKRKLDEHLPSTFPYSYSDTTKDDELGSISARRGDSEFENDSEDVVVEDDDDPDADIGDEEEEEDNDDSMRVFTNARLENDSRKTKIKMENSLLKIDSDIQKLTASNVSAPVVGSGIGVKEILAENLQASGAYSAREESLKREEESGRLKFVCCVNDGIDQHMIWLIGLKNIFARQLPDIPKEYIVRLVMDRVSQKRSNWRRIDGKVHHGNFSIWSIWQRSLTSYIKKFACSNAWPEDLWAALEEGSGEPVNMLMNSWTKQMGYPVISVQLKDNKLEFDQSQFLQSGASGNGQWIVPITLCCGSYEAQKNFLLRTKSESLDVVKLLGSSDVTGNHKQWIKLNVDQAGFYRVKYDDDLQARLRHAIEASSLSATDRFGILDDSYALSMACKQSLSSLFALMSA